jgi:hypothetical protein
MEKQKYTTIQIKKETHELLKQYCEEHGHSITRLIEVMIKQRINPTTSKPQNVLVVSKT